MKQPQPLSDNGEAAWVQDVLSRCGSAGASVVRYRQMAARTAAIRMWRSAARSRLRIILFLHEGVLPPLLSC